MLLCDFGQAVPLWRPQQSTRPAQTTRKQIQALEIGCRHLGQATLPWSSGALPNVLVLLPPTWEDGSVVTCEMPDSCGNSNVVQTCFWQRMGERMFVYVCTRARAFVCLCTCMLLFVSVSSPSLVFWLACFCLLPGLRVTCVGAEATKLAPGYLG